LLRREGRALSVTAELLVLFICGVFPSKLCEYGREEMLINSLYKMIWRQETH